MFSALFLFSLVTGVQFSFADERLALVIGNGAYDASPLANAVNDAQDMAKALRSSGFKVKLITDAEQQNMEEAIVAFGEALSASKGVGLFYYSGHAVQISGQNYLLPIGKTIARERDAKYKAVNMGQVLDEMKAADNGLNIVILDACRDNPLPSSSRSATRGLGRVKSGGGLFVAYATSPGEVALDGKGRNSPFTGHLVKAINKPGLSLEQTFKFVLKGVYAETNGSQIPWISSSFFGDFYFKGGEQQIALATKQTPPQGGQAKQDSKSSRTVTALLPKISELELAAVEKLDGLYRVSGRNPNGSQYTGSLAIWAKDEDAYQFTWWIGKQTFHGNGRQDGRWLRVDWGSTSPVIYTVNLSGSLDGQWADGKATEFVKPYALSGKNSALEDIAGRYKMTGKNPNGTSYRGSITVKRAGTGFEVSWKIGSTQYRGKGKLNNGVFVVDWGQATPAVYALHKPGVFKGLWAAGKGNEVWVRQ